MNDHEDQSPSQCTEHEPLLQAVLAGDLRAEDAAALPLRQCVICSRRLDRMRRVIALLDSAGDEQREILESLREPVERAPAARRWPYWGLAAASLLGVWLLVANPRCGGQEGRPLDEILLHQPKVDPNVDEPSPRGPVDDFDPFAWPATELAPGESFLVEVFDADEPGGPDRPRKLASESLRTNGWSLTAAERSTIAALQKIEWIAYRVTASGDRHVLAHETAVRR